MHLSNCNERFVMESWRKVLLGPDETLKTAIEVLNKEEPRIVLVVDGS